MGYRARADVPAEPLEPTGDALLLAPEDDRALASSRSRERNRVWGMGFLGLLLLRVGVKVAEHLDGPEGVVGAALCVAAVVLLAYAAWSVASPRVLIHSALRIEGDGDDDFVVTAGRPFSLRVSLQPRGDLALDPLLVRVVAERGRKSRKVAYTSEHVLARGRAIAAGEPASYAVRLELPEEAPASSKKRGVTWRVEVTVGAPPRFTRVRRLGVRPCPW